MFNGRGNHAAGVLTDHKGTDALLKYAVDKQAGGLAGRGSDPTVWTMVMSERRVVGQGLDRPTATEMQPFYQSQHHS